MQSISTSWVFGIAGIEEMIVWTRHTNCQVIDDVAFMPALAQRDAVGGTCGACDSQFLFSETEREHDPHLAVRAT